MIRLLAQSSLGSLLCVALSMSADMSMVSTGLTTKSHHEMHERLVFHTDFCYPEQYHKFILVRLLLLH